MSMSSIIGGDVVSPQPPRDAIRLQISAAVGVRLSLEMLLPTLPVKASNRAPRCPGGVSLTAAATSCLILLRHGQSEWNLSNRFTGWADVPLTEQGRKDARYAGELLCEAGVKVG